MPRFRSAVGRFALAGTSLVLSTSSVPCSAQVVQRSLYATNGTVYASTLIGTTLYVGGYFSLVGPAAVNGPSGGDAVPRSSLAALDVVNGRATSWDPSPDNSITALASDDTTVFVGGYFYNIGGKAREHLASIDAATGRATAWDLGTILSPHAVYILALAVDPGIVYVGGYFSYIGGQYRYNFAALDESTGQVTPWNPLSSYRVYTIALGENLVYAGGAFTSIGGQPRQYLAALDATTAQATAWDPNPETLPYALAVGPAVVYAGGPAGTNQDLLGYVTAFDARAGQPPRWHMDTDGPVRALALAGGALFVGGDFTHVNGVPRSYLAALDTATGQPTPWSVTLDGSVETITASGSTIYVGGDFNNVEGQPQNHIAAITTTEVDVPGGHPAPRSLELAIAPNPVHNHARIRYQLPAPARVSLALYDLSGRVVSTLEDRQTEDAGPHEVALDTQVLAAGMYFCRLDAGGASRTTKFLRVK